MAIISIKKNYNLDDKTKNIGKLIKAIKNVEPYIPVNGKITVNRG